MISKSISVSRKLAQISPFAALLFTWLIPHCDDGGNMAGDSFTVKGLVVPVRPETVEDVESAIREISKIGLIDPYDINGERFIHIVQWEDHQTLRMDRATWEYPPYPKVGNQLSAVRQPRAAEVKLREVKLREVKKDYSAAFEEFWDLYPRKASKKKAWQAWKAMKPNESPTKKIMDALKAHSESDQWVKDDGRFIPHPTTWLHQERWNDQLKVDRKKLPSKYDGLKTTKA